MSCAAWSRSISATVVVASVLTLQADHAHGAGSRSVSSVSPVVMVSALNVVELTGTLSVTVEELGRTGTNPWSVRVSASELRSSNGVIPAGELSISSRRVTQVLGGGESSTPAGRSSLDSAQTLWTNTGQSPLALYTGTYTGSSTVHLSIPNSTPTGVYAGTLTVSLVQ